MGSSSSKVARGAARKYPTRAPGSTVPSAPPPRAKPAAKPAAKSQAKTWGGGSKDDAIRADAMDPDFAPGDFSRRLQQMGVAEPNPTYSPSSTAAPQVAHQMPPGPSPFPSARSNQTLTALDARQRLQEQAEEDLEAMNRGAQGRRFLDMRTVVDALKLRDHGVPNREIEAKLRIQPGLLETLGRKGIISHVNSPS